MKLIVHLFHYLFNKYRIINRIGFYVNEEFVYDIYKNVLFQIDSNKFDIILEDKFIDQKYRKFLSELSKNSWSIKFRNDVIWRYKYKYLITHIYVGGNVLESPSFPRRLLYVILKIFNKFFRALGYTYQIHLDEQYFPRIIGLNNIRFMYGVDSGGEKFGQENYLYDIFFCHGPRDAAIIESTFKKQVIQMGYPRYDKFFEIIGSQREDWLKSLQYKFSCDNSKKTILWVTTVYTQFSTIELYYKEIEKLAKYFNVIVRPHPLEIDPTSNRFKPSVLKIIQDNDFIVADDCFQDMTELYMLADFVLADYAGTIFSALYLDRKILLLNNPMANEVPELATSTSFEVRKFLPSIDVENASDILNLLKDPGFWDFSESASIKARSYYFGDLRGNSLKRVVPYLNQLDFKDF